MPQRSEALYRGRIIGIESIYTVIDGKQINIPEKLKDLREKSRRNELFCPCGCGNNLILVAGDKNLREQHFREKHSDDDHNCTYTQEGALSVYSKIVLKCWLEDKLKAVDIEDHVPISDVDNTKRRYEFSFLSRSKHLAVNYCRKRENLSDEKLGILDANTKGIRVIHVVDLANADTKGQYPEGLMKIQSWQGYCLLLEVEGYDYFKASMQALFYAQDVDGLWEEPTFAEGRITDFDIADDGEIWFGGRPLKQLLTEAQDKFEAEQLAERKRRAEAEAKRLEEVARREAERKQREGFSGKKLEEGFVQQETKVPDSNNIRWFRCEFCGKIAKEEEFAVRGSQGKLNLGICKAENCLDKLKEKRMAEIAVETSRRNGEPYKDVCPYCHLELVKKEGKFGPFLACPNYPSCRFTKKISKY